MFFNLHTHLPAVAANVIAIRNISEGFDTLPGNGVYSVGLHPWFLDAQSLEDSFLLLAAAAELPSVWAIGECGLDKVCTTSWQLQLDAFGRQLILANRLQKPLVLHCVKAFGEVQHLLQQHHVQVPVIFHGFNKSPQLAQQLVNKGYYLSLGKHLEHERMQQLLQQIPLEQLFFETDDILLSINEVYEMAAAGLHTSVEILCLRLAENVQRVFGKGLNPI